MCHDDLTVLRVARQVAVLFEVAAMVSALMLITYVSKISLWLPELTALVTAAP
jgi:TRAP-type C4-dicarboxylate transport system permease large subunit